MKKQPFSTINEIIRSKSEEHPEKTVFRVKKNRSWKAVTWDDFRRNVENLGSSLMSLGVKKGDFAVIFSELCYEWEMIEKTLFYIGAVSVGLDPKSSKEEIEEMLEDLRISAVFISRETMAEKLPPKVRKKCRIVLISGKKKNPGFHCLEALTREPAKKKDWNMANENDPAALVFTSGTTGKAKKILYRQKHLALASLSVAKLFEKDKESIRKAICWLPLIYMTSKMMILVNMILDIETFFVTNPKEIMKNIKEIGPGYFLGVPRFFEKVYIGITENILEQPWPIRTIGKIILWIDKQKHFGLIQKITYHIFAKKIREKIFGSELRYMISGTAPISPVISRFFGSINLPVLEAYALSENAIPMSMNSPEKSKIGTVGLPLRPNKIRIAKDKEVLVKGPGVFEGYFKGNAKENGKLFTRSGYLKTDDLGHFDKDGFLVLEGRKKYFIKTSTGIGMSPHEIEKKFKDIPVIENLVVIGNQRKFISALVTLNEDQIKRWAGRNGMRMRGLKKASKDPGVIDFIKREIEKKNGELGEFKRIRRFSILPKSFSVKSGEMNKNFKLKRAAIEKKYKKQIDGMYKE